MSLDHAILGFLSERPRSGYDLKTRCFANDAMSFWDADQAQIYRTLGRLEEARLVVSRRSRSAGRPDRRVHEITRAGSEELARWSATPLELGTVRDPFALQLWFGASLNDATLLDLIASRRQEHVQRLASLKNAASLLAEQRSVSDRTQVLRQTAYDGAIARERASIDWLDECIVAIEQGALPGSDADSIGQRHLFGETPA
ncbi:MAG: PadR family transcriptional regulator [Actinobacteria bacterium]|nr:MAG: PadR family transcriptional regulator [Actinomycetota bacterium]